MKATLLFGLVAIAIVGVLAWVLGLVFTAPGDHRAIAISAVVALVVQLLAFALVRRMATRDVMTGWGVGAGLRFVVLAVYGLVVVRALGLPIGSALVSLAAFFFLSTLVEPLLLKT